MGLPHVVGVGARGNDRRRRSPPWLAAARPPLVAPGRAAPRPRQSLVRGRAVLTPPRPPGRRRSTTCSGSRTWRRASCPCTRTGRSRSSASGGFRTGTSAGKSPRAARPMAETPLEGARRELPRRRGWRPPSGARSCGCSSPTPPPTRWRVGFLATGLTPCPTAPEATEELAVARVPFREALHAAVTGRIVDSITVAMLLRLHHMAVEGELDAAAVRPSCSHAEGTRRWRRRSKSSGRRGRRRSGARLRQEAEAAARAEPSLGSAAERRHPRARRPRPRAELPAGPQAGRRRAERHDAARASRRRPTPPSPALIEAADARPARGVRARPRLQGLPAALPLLQGLPGAADPPRRPLAVGRRAARRWPSTCRAGSASCSRSTSTPPPASARACSSTTARASWWARRRRWATTSPCCTG